MIDWKQLWPYTHTWWGWTVGVVSAFLAIYHGPRKVWETYDWYMEKLFDHKVSDFLETKVTKGASMNGKRLTFPTPTSVEEIATATGFSTKRVLGCLRRLKRKKAVANEGERWKINAS